jgi:hypothetical protein
MTSISSELVTSKEDLDRLNRLCAERDEDVKRLQTEMDNFRRAHEVSFAAVGLKHNVFIVTKTLIERQNVTLLRMLILGEISRTVTQTVNRQRSDFDVGCSLSFYTEL